MKKVLLASLNAWIDHRDASKGAALAFYTLFAMTPILMLAIAVAGYFFGAEAAQGKIIDQLQGTVGPNGAQAIQALLAAACNPAAGRVATMVAGVLLVIGATSVFVELKESLDEIWCASPHGCSSAVLSLLRTRFLSFLLVLILAFLLFVALVCGAAFAVLARFSGGIWSSFALVVFSSLLSLGTTTSLFAVIYKVLPAAPLSWRDVWFGAVVTAGLFDLGKHAIGLYLGSTGVASSFGAAGSLVAFLLWVYYSAQIFFLGAEFTRQYALSFGSLKSAEPVAAEKNGEEAGE